MGDSYVYMKFNTPLLLNVPHPLVIRRLLINTKIDKDGCWIYKLTGGSDRKGYRRIKVDGKFIYAHRLSYAAFCGPIPEGLTVHHKCLIKQCINPEHLEIMSLSDNSAEGTSRRDKNNGNDEVPF